jgi:ABC-2 type transport system ATP-binding protein
VSAYAIRMEGLTKRFAAFGRESTETLAVDGVSLNVCKGEVFGFLGPNGAGKTTTVRMLCALVAPTSGSAWVNGHRLGSEDDAIRASVGILTETPGLYAKLDAVANLTFFAKLYRIDDIASQVQKYLQLLGLWERRYQLVGSFSKGMRQRLAIARALLHEPSLLFLDEPTSGLDPEAARTVRDFIQELSGRGRTIFLCTHNLDEADRLCDRVAVIKGRLVSVDEPARLRQRLYGVGVLVRLCSIHPSYIEAVKALPFVNGVAQMDGALSIELESPEQNNPHLIRALVEAGAGVQYVEEISHSLESVYFDLMAQAEEEVS